MSGKKIVEMVDHYSLIKKDDSGVRFKKRVWIFEACPKCGCMGRIDKDQAEGKVSIICHCGHHYYKKVNV